MAYDAIKAERVVRAGLGLLERQVVLPRLVWRDAAGDFRGAKNDTITVRVPAYFKSNKRSLRSGTARTKSTLTERSVDVTLTDDLYGVVDITDEEITLDIEAFDRQVTVPVLGGIARGMEDELTTLMEGATYQHTITVDTTSPYEAVTEARQNLNDSQVPMDGRALAVGSELERHFLNSPQFVRADQSGSAQTLREAEIGRIAGFPVFAVPALAPDQGYAFHRTAYVLNSRAPMVPDGAPWGASESWEGFAIRVLQMVATDDPVTQFHADAWVGTNTVRDYGSFDADGKFEPAENPDLANDTPLFVRAVQLQVPS